MISRQRERPSGDVLATSALKQVMASELKKKHVPPHIKMLAGMAGGVAEACMLQPLDVTKTRLQLDKAGKYKGMVHCGQTIVKEEGAGALYKGLTPFVTHLTLKYALRFGAFQWFKETISGGKGKASNGTNFAAGLLTGCLESVLIVTPFEVVKTRLQQEVGHGRYKGPLDCVRQIIRNEGVTAMWKGNIPTMVRQGSNQAFNFMAFAWLNHNVWAKEEGDGKQLEAWKTIVNGLVAGSIGPCLNCPMDVIKTRLMAQETVRGQEPKYRGFIHAFRLIAKEEGSAALWKGLIPRLTRLAPGQAITWTVVMRVTSMFEQEELLQ